jgi:hypothetical protein
MKLGSAVQSIVLGVLTAGGFGWFVFASTIALGWLLGLL